MVLRGVIRSWVTPLERFGGTSLLENYGTSSLEIFLKYQTALDVLADRQLHRLIKRMTQTSWDDNLAP